jgi:epoxyqueuosine reductase
MMTTCATAELTRKIRQEADRLGFTGMGVAPAGPLPFADRFNSWLENGFHGQMNFLKQQVEKRQNPRLVLPDARTVLLLAVNYHTGGMEPDGPDDCSHSPLNGIISRYARYNDYHPVVKSRLLKLLAFIQSCRSSVNGRCHVDTGPVMEKVWGSRSALGWTGKNSMLIARRTGSWFFIGTILLDTVLEYDHEAKDFCGSCRRCIEACPTGALVEPYVVDARRCVSYLTVECRGIMPMDLRARIGNRIFGCDACQEVCPWNRCVESIPDRELVVRNDCSLPDLIELASLSREEFDVRYRESPIRRITRDGFVRNSVVALGNSGCEEILPALEKAVRDHSTLVRVHAAWSLGRIASPAFRRVLEAAGATETDPMVLEEIDCALEGR